MANSERLQGRDSVQVRERERERERERVREKKKEERLFRLGV